MFDVQFFLSLLPTMLRYLGTTLWISVAALAIALLIALGMAMAVELRIPVLHQISVAWKSLFRGTPLLAQLFWLCYGLPQIIPPLKSVSVMTLLIFGIGFNASAYMAESLRGAIFSVGKGQMEACLSSGMTTLQGMGRIVLPQAVRVAVPALANNFVDIIKQSSLAFTLGIKEIMAVAKMEGASAYKFLEAFTAVMLFYWLTITVFNKLQAILENQLNKKV
ncbi:amino acid ABC transporter permease [Ruminococcaceae bacterium OttesenSCG-928-L11]|nr:amino acid ABC transporter permease [Ruminococcaceae bacterium OttesenSCG-928-L11]